MPWFQAKLEGLLWLYDYLPQWTRSGKSVFLPNPSFQWNYQMSLVFYLLLLYSDLFLFSLRYCKCYQLPSKFMLVLISCQVSLKIPLKHLDEVHFILLEFSLINDFFYLFHCLNLIMSPLNRSHMLQFSLSIVQVFNLTLLN